MEEHFLMRWCTVSGGVFGTLYAQKSCPTRRNVALADYVQCGWTGSMLGVTTCCSIVRCQGRQPLIASSTVIDQGIIFFSVC